MENRNDGCDMCKCGGAEGWKKDSCGIGGGGAGHWMNHQRCGMMSHVLLWMLLGLVLGGLIGYYLGTRSTTVQFTTGLMPQNM